MSGATADLVAALYAAAETLPASALDAARGLIQDFVGIALFGSTTAEGRFALEVARQLESPGPSGVPGSGMRLAPQAAAFVSGTMGYSIGLGDTHTWSITHPGASVIPAALAIGEAVGAGGEQIERAVVLGVELVTRIGAAVSPSHRARGFHPTATCNPFGVALATGYLLDLPFDKTISAIGIAGSTSGGLYEFRKTGDTLMALHGGWPAHSGIYAAYLARAGFTGPATVLEGEEGFFTAFADNADLTQLDRDAGDPWRVGELSMRPYAACRYAHAALDALASLRREHEISSVDVDRVTIWTHHTAVEQEVEPTTLTAARLCTRFNVAMGIVNGVGLAEVTDADLVDPALQHMMSRIEIREDPALTALFPEKWPCRIDLVLRDGARHIRQVDVPLGDPANPMTAADLDQKFRTLAGKVLDTSATERLLSRLHDFGRAAADGIWSSAADASTGNVGAAASHFVSQTNR